MATLYHNINGAGVFGTTVQLLAPGDVRGAIKSLLVANTDSGSITVTISVKEVSEEKAAASFSLVHEVVIPPGASLLIDDESVLLYNMNVYGLYITLGSSDTADGIIRV